MGLGEQVLRAANIRIATLLQIEIEHIPPLAHRALVAQAANRRAFRKSIVIGEQIDNVGM